MILENTLGVTLITKVREILMIETDFHSLNKIMYGVIMMGIVVQNGYMLEEIFSEKNRMADDGTIAKTIFLQNHKAGTDTV